MLHAVNAIFFSQMNALCCWDQKWPQKMLCGWDLPLNFSWESQVSRQQWCWCSPMITKPPSGSLSDVDFFESFRKPRKDNIVALRANKVVVNNGSVQCVKWHIHSHQGCQCETILNVHTFCLTSNIQHCTEKLRHVTSKYSSIVVFALRWSRGIKS